MAKKTQTGIELQRARGMPYPMMDDQLGRVLRSADMADYLGLDEKTVRLYYLELGGIRLGRRILFFEKEVINAIQKRSKMGGSSASMREAEGKNLPEQKRCGSVGKRESVKSRGDMAGEDKHGILV
jgi:hypothetical protein